MFIYIAKYKKIFNNDRRRAGFVMKLAHFYVILFPPTFTIYLHILLQLPNRICCNEV